MSISSKLLGMSALTPEEAATANFGLTGIWRDATARTWVGASRFFNEPSTTPQLVREILPQGNGTTLSTFGMVAPTATGTPTTSNVSVGSGIELLPHLLYASSASAGSSCGLHSNVLQATIAGNNMMMEFWVAPDRDAAAVANARWFVGIHNSASVLPNGNPSALTNMFGVGMDSGDSEVYLMHNDGSGTATKIELTGFDPAWLQTGIYIRLITHANTNERRWFVTRFNTIDASETYTGDISTNLPDTAEIYSPHIWRNNGSTALAVRLGFAGFRWRTGR